MKTEKQMAMATAEFVERWKGIGNVSQSVRHIVRTHCEHICAQNAQCWARLTKNYMERQRYNKLKAAIEQEQRLVPSKNPSCEH